MNLTYRLIWNRVLRIVQVASELTHSPRGGNDGVVDARPRGHRHPLALACAAGVALGVFALPAWAGTCVVNGVTYTNCTVGTAGQDGTSTAGGQGSTPGTNDGGAPGAAGEGASNSGGRASGAGGAGNTGGGAGGIVGNTGVAGAGGGGGSVETDGLGGGGSGGVSGSGGGGGGGAGVGLVVNTDWSNAGTDGVAGGEGGEGATGSGGGNPSAYGGPGGGGAGVLASGSGITIQNAGGIVGGQGGSNPSLSNGAGGGGGGAGLLVTGTAVEVSNAGTIAGGSGGVGDEVISGGGGGGAGVAGSGFVLTNAVGANITGGAGGAPGVPSGSGPMGVGGVGVVSTGNSQITSAGSIAGGLAGDGTTRAGAVAFSGGGNVLTLENGYTFTGNVGSTSVTTNGGDTLALGGTTNDSFAVSNVVATQPTSWTGTVQYYGFAQYAKTGSSTWTLTGTTAVVTPWTISQGTLSVSSDSNLGAASGALTFNGGTLQFGSGFNLASTRAITLDAGGGTIDTNSYATTISQAMTGSGGLTVADSAGSGTLTLTGTNTYSGDTEVDAGRLVLSGTGSIADSSDVIANGTFDISGTTAGASITSLDGTGTANVGAQTLTLSDAAGTFSGTFTGTGNLTLASGTETLDGDSSGFTGGTTTVAAGTLIVGSAAGNGAVLGTAVTVQSGATLAGNGTIGGLDLAGTLSPGNASVGTLHVTGNATFAPGSTFIVDATPTGQSDQLAVGGAVTIGGGAVMSLEQAGNWAPLTQYTIVTGAGGVSGQFASVSTSLAFLDAVLSYPTDAVQLTLERNDINFNTVAQTPNQKGAATGANGLGFGNTIYNAIVMLDAPTARYAFDQLSGEYDASQETARIDDSRYVREAMNQRLIQGSNDPEAAKLGDTQVTAWAHAWGHWATTDSDGNAGKLSDNGDGLLIGADVPVGQGRIGVTGGASRNTLSVGARDSWGRLTSQWLGAFGGFDVNHFALRGGIAYAWDQIPTNREVSFPGYTDGLSSNASGSTLTGYVEGAYTFQWGQTAISPFLNIAHTRVETDASTEAGGAAALHAEEGSANVTLSTLGARGMWQVANHIDLDGELGWQHAFNNVTPDRTMQFVDGGPAFTEYGVPIAQNAGLARIGLDWHASKTVSVDADYEGLWGGGAKDNAAKLSFNIAL